MPDRHRHDLFIWALILSMIINLLVLSALFAQHVRDGEGKQPFIVSIKRAETFLQHNAQNKPRGNPAFTKKAVQTALNPSEQNARKDSDVARPEEKKEQDHQSFPAAVTGGDTGSARSGTGAEITTTAPVSDGTTAETSLPPGPAAIEPEGDLYFAPELLPGTEPDYPIRAKRNKWEGTVLLAVSINASGQVIKVAVVQSSGYDLLDRSACVAAQGWKFKPARSNGIAVTETIHLPVIFRHELSERVP